MFKEELCGAVEALRALKQVKVAGLQPPPAAFLQEEALPALQALLASPSTLLRPIGPCSSLCLPTHVF